MTFKLGEVHRQCVLKVRSYAGKYGLSFGTLHVFVSSHTRPFINPTHLHTFIVLNFTRGWTETHCWNGIRDHFKHHTEICPRALRAYTGASGAALFCDTREVRCRFVRVGEKLLRRGELYYIQSALPETLHFPRLF